MSDGAALVHEICAALAAVDRCAPHELEYALHDHVDTTALERLEAMPDASWRLEFSVPGHDVAVSSDGRILVDGVLQRTVGALDARR